MLFACLHASAAPPGDVIALAAAFSPVVEKDSAPGTAIFPIDGLERLIGTPSQIASEICRQGSELGIYGSLAICGDPDTAVLLARYCKGVTMVHPGQEATALAHLPIATITGDPESDPAYLAIFEQWGIRTLGQLAALPLKGLVERFGVEGMRLHKLARGNTRRTLRVIADQPAFRRRVELDYSVELLEPLQFVISSMLHELTAEMRHRGLAAERARLTLELINRAEHVRGLELATPLSDPLALLKLLYLDLETNPPQCAITAVRLDLDPAPPQILQHGLFLPKCPEPQKLQIVVARLSGLLGKNNVGSPLRLDTYRPDAHELRSFAPASVAGMQQVEMRQSARQIHLAFRVFRPPRHAVVRLNEDRPVSVHAPGVRGAVRTASGPWMTSGEWWTGTHWHHEEWDVDLDNGVFRLFKAGRGWFVEGVYD
jgi:protein ImuB